MATYLIRPRGKGFAFRIAVPLALRGRFKRAWVVEGLGTDSRRKAEEKATKRKAHWQTVFERAAADVPLTLPDIEEAALEVYADTLARLERDAPIMAPLVGGEREWLESLGRLSDDPPLVEIAAVERRHGFVLDPASQTYGTLTRALQRAIKAAIEGRLRRLLEDQPSEPPRSFLGAEGIDALTLKPISRARQIIRSDGGLRFSEAGALYLEEVGSTMRTGTIAHHRRVQKLFATFVRDQAISQITRADAADFLAKLRAKRVNPKGGQLEGLSARTVNTHRNPLSQVFKWARRRGKMDGSNPFEDQQFKEADPEGWLPFTKDELDKLVKPEAGALYWPMMVSLYSGMRLNEVCGLRVEDVGEEHGVQFFEVSEHAGRLLKTKAAKRRIPIHSKLIDAGFMEYVSARDKRVDPKGDQLKNGTLFDVMGPEGKPGKYVGQKFGRYREQAGVTRERLSFHSFRKNFATAMDQAGVHIDDAAALLGHRRSFSWSVYSSGPGLQRLKDVIEKISY